MKKKIFWTVIALSAAMAVSGCGTNKTAEAPFRKLKL